MSSSATGCWYKQSTPTNSRRKCKLPKYDESFEHDIQSMTNWHVLVVHVAHEVIRCDVNAQTIIRRPWKHYAVVLSLLLIVISAYPPRIPTGMRIRD